MTKKNSPSELFKADKLHPFASDILPSLRQSNREEKSAAKNQPINSHQDYHPPVMTQHPYLFVVKKMKNHFFQNLIKNDYASRWKKISQIRQYIVDHQEALISAIKNDHQKPDAEIYLSEIMPVLLEINLIKRRLKKWMRPKNVSTPALLFGHQSQIVYQPQGVILILSPWNYPFSLSMIPLVSALAAGNHVVIKPSESTPTVAHFIKTMTEVLFNEEKAEEVKTVLGDANEAAQWTQQPFDHIFFTGSTAVGRQVLKAASDNLAITTLELGGKSPAYLHHDAFVQQSCEQLVWGKFFNAGQTCIAPDYLLCHEKIYAQVLEQLKKVVSNFYGETENERLHTKDLASIINHHHFDRLKSIYLKAQADPLNLEIGGTFDRGALRITPTILSGLRFSSPLMEEEIFGPLFPVIKVASEQEAIDWIQSQPKPLACYLFTENSDLQTSFKRQIQAGGMAVNQTLLQEANHSLPFGGCNHSGLGAYHGEWGFKTFSHSKAVMTKNRWTPIYLIRPPYRPFFKNMLAFIGKRLFRWVR
jgi:aldehyde dehydrogenase (NAD+)